MEEVISSPSFKLKGRLYTLTVLHLFNTDLAVFSEQLSEAVKRAPKLFEQTPIVLDCTALVETPFDLDSFCQKMRQFGLFPVGIQNSSPAIQAAAQKLGLPLLHGSSQPTKSQKEDKNPPVERFISEPTKAKLYSAPIRSGQQIISSGDLIVTSQVSPGAELLAEGHMHIYGALRGRALAGITGDKQARIYCQALEAELVAIAGIYCLSDAMPKKRGPCQIFLQDDCIQIESL